MSNHFEPRSRQLLSQALGRMNEALRILDELGAPGVIGSHLDLAIARLEKQLAEPKNSFVAARLATETETDDIVDGKPLNPWDIHPV